MAQWTKALELMQEVVGSNPGLDKFFYIFFLQKQIANPCSEKRETPVQITGKPCLKYRETMLGLQGNPCLDYRETPVGITGKTCWDYRETPVGITEKPL